MAGALLVLVAIIGFPVGLSGKTADVPAPVPKVELVEPLKTVCSCESTGNPYSKPRQFNADGTVLRGKINSHDIGMCQINEVYHAGAATKMGIDIYTEQGNIKYANFLYQHEGTKPWDWSKNCWKKK